MENPSKLNRKQLVQRFERMARRAEKAAKTDRGEYETLVKNMRRIRDELHARAISAEKAYREASDLYTLVFNTLADVVLFNGDPYAAVPKGIIRAGAVKA